MIKSEGINTEEENEGQKTWKEEKSTADAETAMYHEQSNSIIAEEQLAPNGSLGCKKCPPRRLETERRKRL